MVLAVAAASLGSFLMGDGEGAVVAASLEAAPPPPAAAAPNRMLAMSLGSALKPCSRTGLDSSKDLIWAFSCSICFVSLASSSVKPPLSEERRGAWAFAAIKLIRIGFWSRHNEKKKLNERGLKWYRYST